MCQRQYGNFGPHSKARKVNITITRDTELAWYKTSDIARHGFCRLCGSGLFWEPFDLDATGIIAGTLDGPTGLKTIGHIFVGEKGDFYDITDSRVRELIGWGTGRRLQMIPAPVDVSHVLPGQIPPEPHDSWVVGDAEYVSLHFLDPERYAR